MFQGFDELGFPVDVEVPDGFMPRMADAGSYEAASVEHPTNFANDFTVGRGVEFTRDDAMMVIQQYGLHGLVLEAIETGYGEEAAFARVAVIDARQRTGGLIERTLRELFSEPKF